MAFSTRGGSDGGDNARREVFGPPLIRPCGVVHHLSGNLESRLTLSHVMLLLLTLVIVRLALSSSASI